MNNLLVGTASEVNPVLHKHIYLTGKSKDYSDINFLLGNSPHNIRNLQRRMPCLVLLLLIAVFFSAFPPSEALALPFIFNHSMAALLASSAPLCFFMNIFYTVQAGWKFIQEQREHGRSCSVCKPHLQGFCQCWNLHTSWGEFSRSYLFLTCC